jgi:hypothetical protein
VTQAKPKGSELETQSFETSAVGLTNWTSLAIDFAWFRRNW